ncbi:hypothetical protein PINS_up013923 [Pythium insidiosum]|nr:hypothetical protein PINS_up013923 [Pythium insidiosum]
MTAAQSLQWTQCNEDIQGVERAQCARVSVPLCYDGLCSDAGDSQAIGGAPSEMELRMLRCLSSTDPLNATTPTLFALADTALHEGPVDSTYNWAANMKTWCSTKYSINANVYILESRLKSLSFQWWFASQGRQELSDILLSVNALDFFEKTLGAGRLEALSVTAAALDLAHVLPIVLPAGRRAFLMAYETDTRVIERFLQLPSTKTVRDNAVRGYVLVAPTPMAARDRDQRFAAVADRWLTQCDMNGKCTTMKPTDFKTTYDMLDGKTNGTNCAHLIRQRLPRWLDEQRASFTLRFYLGVMPRYGRLFRSVEFENGIPDAIRRCEDRDFKALVKWLHQVKHDMRFGRLLLKRVPAVEHFLQLTELWPDPAPTQAELDQRLAATRVSDGFLAAQVTPHCALLPHANASACENARPYAVGVDSHLRPRLRMIRYKQPNVSFNTPLDWGDADLLVLADPALFEADAVYAKEMVESRSAVLPVESKVNAVVVRFHVAGFGSDRDRAHAVIKQFICTDPNDLRGVWDVSKMQFLDANRPWTRGEFVPGVSIEGMTLRLEYYQLRLTELTSLYDEDVSLSTVQLVVLIASIIVAALLVEVALTVRHNRIVRERTPAQDQEEEQTLASGAVTSAT